MAQVAWTLGQSIGKKAIGKLFGFAGFWTSIHTGCKVSVPRNHLASTIWMLLFDGTKCVGAATNTLREKSRDVVMSLVAEIRQLHSCSLWHVSIQRPLIEDALALADTTENRYHAEQGFRTYQQCLPFTWKCAQVTRPASMCKTFSINSMFTLSPEMVTFGSDLFCMQLKQDDEIGNTTMFWWKFIDVKIYLHLYAQMYM